VIFVAVGTQFPFNRLIKAVDEWVGKNNETAFAQIAEGDYLPKHMQWERFLDAQAYNDTLEQASLIVAHAGMGNIITACEKQIPIIVMNRQYKLGEHRNDHQADGLTWMGQLAGVYTASNNEELLSYLDNHSSLEQPQLAESSQRNELIQYINSQI